MPMIYKVLGQVDAANTNLITLYTVPSSAQTIVSTIVVCNRASSNLAYNIAVSPNGAAIANAQYIAFNGVIPSLDTIAMTLGLTLGNNDVVRVQATAANSISFSVYGTEIT